jgi:glycosyltransferase involved in cell wall biosynthesis
MFIRIVLYRTCQKFLKTKNLFFATLKILHIIPNLVKGGAQRITIDICRELSKRPGIEVKLIYFSGVNEFEFLTKDIDIEHISITFKLSFRKKSQINLTAYEKLVDAFQPDVIHSHLYLAELISREFPRSNILYFTHCHDNIVQLQKPKISTFFNRQRFIDTLERRRLLKRYRACNNHFIAIAQDGVFYLKNILPKDFAKSIHLLPNAIDTDSFKSQIERENIIHHLINVGNFIPKKNQFFLIDILAEIKSKGYNLGITLVGDGITLNEVRNKAEKLKITDQVEFKGKTDDIRSELQKSSIYVHSALYEPFGLVILEAMAAGLPVVTLDGKGNRDLIQDGKNGFLVDQGDRERFVQCILRLIEDQSLYKRIQTEGYKTAQQYDIHPYVDRLLAIYSKEKQQHVI